MHLAFIQGFVLDEHLTDDIKLKCLLTVLEVAVGVSTMPVTLVTEETSTQQCLHKPAVAKEPIWECCIILLGILVLGHLELLEPVGRKLNVTHIEIL